MKLFLLINYFFQQSNSAAKEGMSLLLKDWIQSLQWTVAIFGSLSAAFIGVFQLRASTKQREGELRWKKASLARDILNEMWKDPHCADAILMLEWKHREYHVKDGKGEALKNTDLIMVSHEDVLAALGKPGEPLDEKLRYIRDCFVRFFKLTEVVGHYVTIGLLDIEDLRYPYRFYLRKINEGENVYYDFLKAYNFKNSLQLFAQIKQMKQMPDQGLKEESHPSIYSFQNKRHENVLISRLDSKGFMV